MGGWAVYGFLEWIDEFGEGFVDGDCVWEDLDDDELMEKQEMVEGVVGVGVIVLLIVGMWEDEGVLIFVVFCGGVYEWIV